MMGVKIAAGFLVFCLMGLVSSLAVCIDNEAPGAPGGLRVNGGALGIVLSWEEAVDSPSCSGIDYYVVYRDDVWIGNTSELSFVDGASLGEGSYSYYVYAVDMVGRNEGSSVVNMISTGGGGGSSGGSRSSSYVCDVDWNCTSWGDCADGERVRVCEDLNGCKTSYLKPDESVGCSNGGIISEEQVIVSEDVGDDDDEFFSAMTGAVVGAVGTTGGAVTGAFILVMLFGFVAVRIRKGRLYC